MRLSPSTRTVSVASSTPAHKYASRSRRLTLAPLLLEARDCPATNLIANAAVETPNAAQTAPVSWSTSPDSSNLATFSYPTPGLEGSRSVRVDAPVQLTGDAKWQFDDVPVTPGVKY